MYQPIEDFTITPANLNREKAAKIISTKIEKRNIEFKKFYDHQVKLAQANLVHNIERLTQDGKNSYFSFFTNDFTVSYKGSILLEFYEEVIAPFKEAGYVFEKSIKFDRAFTVYWN